MKTSFPLLFLAFLLACTTEDGVQLKNNAFKEITVEITGVSITSGPLTGGRASDVVPIYLFVEIKKGESLYASGVFKEIPKSLKLRLPDNTDFDIFVKAVKKGSSFGILRYQDGNQTYINWSVAADSLDFRNPIQNGADAGLCYVYTTADSSKNMYQYYPPTDTYGAKVSLNTGNTSATLKINLERKVFGIESRIRNFKQGRIRVILAEEKSSTDPSGISTQEIQYPDSTKLNLFSLMVLHPPRPNVRIRVIFERDDKAQLIFDGWVEVKALEKKILQIDLARYNSVNGREAFVELVEGVLVDGEIIDID